LAGWAGVRCRQLVSRTRSTTHTTTTTIIDMDRASKVLAQARTSDTRTTWAALAARGDVLSILFIIAYAAELPAKRRPSASNILP